MAQEPLSAIDWLSKSVATPAALPVPSVRGSRAPVSASGPSGTITVTPLDGPNLDGLGLVPASRSGLPRNLWGSTSTETLVRTIGAERVDTLPAIQSLLYALLLAELAPPADSDGTGTLFLARVDKLLDLGALDPALAMLELPETTQPEPFRRWFDVALLIGEEDRACEVMRANPQIAPTFPARIYCLARGGDWNAAALSLRTGEALGYIEPDMATLLTWFLDPELADGEEPLEMPERPSPLVLRLMEAVGQPIATTALPVAFAQADLRANTGWKTRIEAAERLARMGAIEANKLFGLYTEQKAAASGGVWDRVRAIQALDQALDVSQGDAAGTALREAWQQMAAIELEVPFASFFGERISKAGYAGEAGRLAFKIGLLSEEYEQVAVARAPAADDEPFLIGLARGNLDGLLPPDQMGVAIKAAFEPQAPLSDEFDALIAEKRLGEALLRAIDHVTEGARGDIRNVTAGLQLLRHVGLEAVARKAALQLLLLERRG